jgi:phenylacetate-CoA ligase
MSRDNPTDGERYPGLSEEGRHMLSFLREHPHASIYRNQSGHRLRAEDVERVRAFESEVQAASVDFMPGTPPPWVSQLVQHCFDQVPFYRQLGSAPLRFEDLPTIGRADLSRDIAAFVPDSAPVEELINFQTSGTTGHPILIASHPVVSASYLAFHKRALRRFGIELRYGRGQVGVVLLGHQRECFTYVSVTPTMSESGLAKINLHPNDWRQPSDRERYLEALAPEVFWGDPISYAELLKLGVRCRPRALLSTSMALPEGLREALAAHFECPVLDVYSMNEAGPVAVFDPRLGAHALLQHRLYVEILDELGQPLPPGERGEITLTGGFNFCLPLLRYRTGDHAVLRSVAGELVLEGLQGRPPVRFQTTSGEWLNNIEITRALGRFALAQFTLHQDADSALRLRYAGSYVREEELETAVRSLFGSAQLLAIEALPPSDSKTVQYTSDLVGALAGSG